MTKQQSYNLGHQHGLAGSACPSRVGNERYMEGFVRGWRERELLRELMG